MSVPNLGAMRAVAERIDRVGLPYAFVGGSVVNLLIDHPELTPARPTDDVDVIIEMISGVRYSDVESKLRVVGFNHDMRQGAPKCRWTLGGLTVDIMPTDGAKLGLNTTWFTEALATPTIQVIAHSEFRIVSPVAFSRRNIPRSSIAVITIIMAVTIWKTSRPSSTVVKASCRKSTARLSDCAAS